MGEGVPATTARIQSPADVVFDPRGGFLITDYANSKVRRVDASGIITTVAGTGTAGYSGDGGPATAAMLSSPTGIAIDSLSNIFISDIGNHRIRKVDPSGTITTVAGTGVAGYSGDGGSAVAAELNWPARVALDENGAVFIADFGNERVRVVSGLGSPAAPTFSSSVPSSPGNDTSPRITGDAPVGSTVRLYTNAACTSAVAATGTAAEFASSGLAVSVTDDTSTTFFGTATDSAGNLSGCSATSFTYVEDSTPPGPPTIDASPGALGSDTSPTWTFSAEAGAGTECRLTRGGTVISPYGSCTASRTYDLSTEGDGTYTFAVRAVDGADNIGPETTATYDLDATVPEPDPDPDPEPSGDPDSDPGEDPGTGTDPKGEPTPEETVPDIPVDAGEQEPRGMVGTTIDEAPPGSTGSERTLAPRTLTPHTGPLTRGARRATTRFHAGMSRMPDLSRLREARAPEVCSPL